MARYTPSMRRHGLSAMPLSFTRYRRACHGVAVTTLLTFCVSIDAAPNETRLSGTSLANTQPTEKRSSEPVQTLHPAELRALLAAPVAQTYQHQLQALITRGRYDGELDALIGDPQLPTASQEWLLHELVLILRTQPATDAGRQLLRRVQQLPNRTLLWHDFEGRQRALPLVPLARAASVTEQHWQVQERVQQLNQIATVTALQTAITQWPSLNTIDQQAWQQVLHQHPARWQPLLLQLDAVASWHSAPELAVAAARHDASFLAAVLQHGDAADASALLAEWSARPARADDWQWLSIALARPALRSQAWFGIGKRSSDDPTAAARIEAAVTQGDRDATAAWVNAHGDATLTSLQKQLYSSALPAQQAALFGLRLLGTPAAQAALRAAQQDPRMPASLRKELQP